MTVVPRVAIYVRQSVAEEQGIKQQLEDCHREAHGRGWAVVREFIDNETSGSRTRGAKTAWAKMLKAFDDDEFDTLLVNDVDRLTRSISDVLEVRPPKRDIRVITVRGGLDTQSVTGDFILGILVLVAEQEVRLKAARSARYALENRKIGHPAPGKTPYGYVWVTKADRDNRGTRYAVVEAEALIVRRMFDEFLAGTSLGQIARDLNSEGHRTRKGYSWDVSVVRRMLMNPVYAALLPAPQPSGKHRIAQSEIETSTPGAWEPIVSVDFVKATRARLVGVKPNADSNVGKHLLSGLAICGRCGDPMYSTHAKTRPTARKDGSGAATSKKYLAYRCVTGHLIRKADVIDEYVTNICVARLSEPDIVTFFKPSEEMPDPVELHARKISLESREMSIAHFIASGQMNADSATTALAELKVELQAINNAIGRAISRDPLADFIGVEDVHKRWDELSLGRRRSIIDLLMTVIIKPVGGGKRTSYETVPGTIDILWREV